MTSYKITMNFIGARVAAGKEVVASGIIKSEIRHFLLGDGDGDDDEDDMSSSCPNSWRTVKRTTFQVTKSHHTVKQKRMVLSRAAVAWHPFHVAPEIHRAITFVFFRNMNQAIISSWWGWVNDGYAKNPSFFFSSPHFLIIYFNFPSCQFTTLFISL